MKSVCFLFNHDAAHQVAHLAGMAVALARDYPEISVTAALSADTTRTEFMAEAGPDLPKNLALYDLALSPLLMMILNKTSKVAPISRVARLWRHARYLRQFDAIVSSERTCLTLKRRWGANGPKFIHLPHGAGDRNVTHHPEKKLFDLFLLSGEKMKRQMISNDIADAEQIRIIGYPKFDNLKQREPERFFENDNPVFLYNPHFDPQLSSWYDDGPAILEWFYQRQCEYNLIVAPHVMLFRKQLHISLEYKISRRRPDIDAKYYDAPNILIDTDSSRLFDMSYTQAADVYIGDVSSQIYEFLINPRACFFINRWQVSGETGFESWSCGPVTHSANELFTLLPDWQEIAGNFAPRQRALIEQTFGTSDSRPAAQRGAAAVAEYLSDNTHLES